MGPVVGPHARSDRSRDTQVAEPWLPAPEDGRPGEGQRLTPDAPHNGGRPPPPGTAPHHPRGTQPPQGMQAKETVLGPQSHTPAPTARGWRTPTARPVGGLLGEGQRLTSEGPSQWWKAPPPGTTFRHPHSEQRGPARAHAVGLVLGPHARTDRTRDTRVAEPWLPAPEDGRPGEGQRLTPDAPHKVGRPPPPGMAPHHPCGTQPPRGMPAKGTVLGPQTHTPAPTARGWRTPTARPVGGQSGEGQRLNSDAPHNGGRHPPRDVLPPPPPRATPARKGARCGAGAGSPRPHGPHPGHTGRGAPAARFRGRAAGGGTAPDTRRPSQRWQAAPPGDGPPPAPRHAAPTGHAGQGDSVGPTHPHSRAHSTWEPDPNSPPSGLAVGRGTAPDLRRPSQWWKAPPPGAPFRHPHSEQREPARAHAVGPVVGPHARSDRSRDTQVAEPWLPAPEDGRPGEGQRLTPDAPHNGGRPPPPGTAPHHPRGTQPPQGMQAKETVLGPQSHTPAPTARGWRTPTARPVGGLLGEGQRLTSEGPSQWWKAPPPGTTFRHPHSEQRGPARAHAVGPVLGPHARTDRTRDTRVAEPWLPAPEDGRPGEGQRLTPDAPHNVGRPPPPGMAPHHPCGTQPPRGMPAKGTVLGPQTHTPAPTARGWRTPTARPVGGQSGEGQRLNSDAPHNGGRPPPRDALPPPPPRATPARRGARCGAVAGSPRPHRPHPGHTGPRTLAARSRGRAAGGGTAPDTSRSSQWWKAPPPGDALLPCPQRATPARKGAHCGAGAWSPRPHRPHPGNTGRGAPAARSRGQAAAGGTAPDTRRPWQRWQATPPWGQPPPTPAARSPHMACRPRGQCWAPTPTHPRPQHVGRGPQQPAQPAGSRGEKQRLTSDAPHNGGRHPPWDALPPPPQQATLACKGARCGAGAGSPRPHRPHPGHTGRGTLAARSRGRAAGGGTAPDTRRPSQRWQATPPRNGPPPPLRHAAPTGHAGQGDSVRPPHPHSRAHSTWVATPTACPVGGQSGEGQRLTSDAPHTGGRHPPRGRPSATPTGSNASPQGRTLWGWCWVPTPAPTVPGTHGSRNPGCPLQRTGGRERDSA